ncbi:MAG: diguanylate cyclase [Geobacter sp.]|nr:diguanylate cyclase [Geobacter sp.]
MKFWKQLHVARPGSYSLLLACAWTGVIAASLMVSIAAHHQGITIIAQNVARAYLDRDILYRNWNALHGGIYVLTNKGIPPNPYIPTSIKERDLVTPSGRHLTLVNPAYMTRLIYEITQKERKVSGHITSLKPLRPENRPDAWETTALHDFEAGKQEVGAVTTEDNVNYYRLMRPLITDETCLTCHAHQRYKKGDIRGGISIRLPMALFESATNKQVALLKTGHGMIWLMGLIGLYFGYRGLQRRATERDLAEKELKRVNAILETQATTDSLTGICNRRGFLELFHAELLEAKRYGMPLALIFFDIDRFKAINDTYGHSTGDDVLQKLTRTISSMIRQTDIFARFGGEEFVVLVHNNDVKSAKDLAEKMRTQLELINFPKVGNVTCSFGVAQYYPDDTAETFISRADDAMYAAKQAGRNRVETRCDCNPGLL